MGREELHRALLTRSGLPPGTATEGVKHDEDKTRYDLLSVPALNGIAQVLTYGAATKYGERNWELGLDYGRVYRAAIGHLFDWFEGEDLDPESGLPHLWHAGCCIMFLIHYERDRERYATRDNRPGTDDEH